MLATKPRPLAFDSNRDDEVERPPLGDTVKNILEEARMVLPGIQTLFGVQLIVVFHQAFQERLSSVERDLHLAAMALVAVAAALVMTPASYHRRAEPETISRSFVRLSTRLLAWSLYPLMLGISIDFYLVASLITTNDLLSFLLALGLLLILAGLWIVLPSVPALHKRLGS